MLLSGGLLVFERDFGRIGVLFWGLWRYQSQFVVGLEISEEFYGYQRLLVNHLNNSCLSLTIWV